MVSGSDSHGAPVVFSAEKLGISPEDHALNSHNAIVSTYKKLGFLYENYTKTTTETHKIVAQNIFTVLLKEGYLNIQSSKQYYDPKVERFLPDRYVRGTCPMCGANNARGDECPECGEYLEPEELIDPYSTLSDATPVIKETEHYYMDLSALQEPLGKWLNVASENWRKWVKEFSMGWVNQGLAPRPVTRDMKYGIPVPVEGWEDKVLYVWIEAVIGYLSASIEWAQKKGDPSLWEEYWKDQECKHFYFIAGGNVPFHTILWPAEITAYNEKYDNDDLYNDHLLPGETKRSYLNLPFDVPANNMLFYKGKKMSKGDSHGISVDKLIDRYGPDPLRYFFVKYAPEKQDREFIWKDFIDANNNELVANIGNFIFRTLSFCNSRFDNLVPDGEFDKVVQEKISEAFKTVSRSIEDREFVRSIESVLDLGHFANKYFNDEKPWETVKNDPAKASITIYNSIQIVNALRVLLKPFTPFGASKLTSMLNIEDEYDQNIELEQSGNITRTQDNWDFEIVPPGKKLGTPEIIFQKFEYTKDLELLDSTKDTISENYEDLELKIDSKLADIPVVWKKYKNLKIKKLKPDQRNELNIEVMKIIDELQKDRNWRERSLYKGYRDLHEKFSEDVEGAGSVEKLIDIVIKEGQLPKINSFVDIYNFVSIKTGVSIGAHDIDKILGDAEFKVLDEDVEFEEIGTGEKNTARKGEYAYTDKKGVLCRLDTKQSKRTRISEKTTSALVILQGHDHIKEEALKECFKIFDSLLQKFGVQK